jgi:hypothetical protein
MMPMYRVRAHEHIELDPADPTKGTVVTGSDWACINPKCVNFAGDPDKPIKSAEFTYIRAGKATTEYDSRPNIDLSNPRMVSISENKSVLPIKTDVKAFAEKVVVDQFAGDDAMVLASKLAEKAVATGEKTET